MLSQDNEACFLMRMGYFFSLSQDNKRGNKRIPCNAEITAFKKIFTCTAVLGFCSTGQNTVSLITVLVLIL